MRSAISNLLCNFIEIEIRYGCSPINLRIFSQHLFKRNSFGGLLLKVVGSYPKLKSFLTKLQSSSFGKVVGY